MKVLYDFQIFNIQKFGGISRYFVELMNGVAAAENAGFMLPLVASDNGYIRNSELVSCIDTSRFGFLKASTVKKNSIRLNRLYTQFQAQTKSYDIYHPTYYDPYLLDTIGKKPLVITVHDMIHELFNDQYRKSKVAEQKKYIVSRAAKVLTISESTKRDLITLLGVDARKIEVIYLATSFGDAPAVPLADTALPGNYVLYVGDRWHYKNFDFFIRSLTPLLQKDESLRIVCAGSSPFNDQERQVIAGLGITGRLLHFPAAGDDMMVHLYRNARAFVFPTLYEGFGIPVLEAFACGCPVIVSNSSSLPEVGGDACRYIDPRDETSLTAAVQAVIYDESLRADMTVRGYEQRAKFSWSRTTQETLAAYAQL